MQSMTYAARGKELSNHTFAPEFRCSSGGIDYALICSHIRQQLAKATAAKRLGLLAWCCERLLPASHALEVLINQAPAPSVYREFVDTLWHGANGVVKSGNDWKRYAIAMDERDHSDQDHSDEEQSDECGEFLSEEVLLLQERLLPHVIGILMHCAVVAEKPSAFQVAKCSDLFFEWIEIRDEWETGDPGPVIATPEINKQLRIAAAADPRYAHELQLQLESLGMVCGTASISTLRQHAIDNPVWSPAIES